MPMSPERQVWVMDNNDFQELGDRINNAVQNALNSKEFIQIKNTINNSIRSFRTESAAPQRPAPAQPVIVPYTQQTRVKVPGRSAGILLTVFGGIGIGIVALLFLIFSIINLLALSLAGFGKTVIGLLIPFLLFSGMLIAGGRLRKRTKRYLTYRQKIGETSLCPIDILASAIGQSPQFVARDLKKMIRLGMFPDAHLDDEETHLILGYDTYRRYQEMKAKTEKLRAEQKAAEAANPILAEGRQYIQKIREANDALPEEDISQKLQQLETIIGKIFACVEQRPQKLPEIRRFLNYYLPTTLKLVTAYREFSEQPVQGDNINNAKNTIKQTLDTVNDAFAKLLDGLYQDEVMDISSDASVLESMLAQEGLTGGDFEKK